MAQPHGTQNSHSYEHVVHTVYVGPLLYASMKLARRLGKALCAWGDRTVGCRNTPGTDRTDARIRSSPDLNP